MPDTSGATIRGLIHHNLLQVVFQPIASLTDGEVSAHEALIRGPAKSPLELPEKLFELAARQGARAQLELSAIACALAAIDTGNLQGRFFLNLSGMVLVATVRDRGLENFISWLEGFNVPLSKIVFEITEHERITDVELLREITESLCAKGIQFALDDFGDGHSSLRLWAEIQPRYVKIDKFFSVAIESNHYKSRTFKALEHISEILGGTLIAEGIENNSQLEIIRDLGITLGQGYFIGMPQARTVSAISLPALQTIKHRAITIYTESAALSAREITADRLLINAPHVYPEMCNGDVLAIFQDKPELHALAVVANGRPVGLINRRDFMERFTRPYQKELLARRHCEIFMNRRPTILERSSSVSKMISLLTSEDQRYLADGFIITENGSYLGLGTGEQLVRTVTEQRLEAARHANPLTFLPGNIPISQHLEKLLKKKTLFYTAYCDLNHFKPFNDQYGYWRGDEMIRLLARVLMAGVDNHLDFIGHVGGDDFVVIFQSPDWLVRCEEIVAAFNSQARDLFDPEALELNGIQAEGRDGVSRFFPLTTLAVGVAPIDPGKYRHAEQIATAAAAAKRQAKRLGVDVWHGVVPAENRPPFSPALEGRPIEKALGK